MGKPVKLDDAAYGKVEIFAKDNDLSLGEAATKLIMQNADLLTATAISENSNCHWDLFNLNLATGEKDFSCVIKRQRPDLRAIDKMPVLNAEYCKMCPRMKTLKDVLKLERAIQAALILNKKAPPQSVPAKIKAEIEKDTAEPIQQATSSRVIELKGMGLVGCDNCHATFQADNVDNLLDDLVQHKKQMHGTTQISHNEANQIRWAREKLEKEEEAAAQ